MVALIGDRLKEARLAKGLTQAALGRLIGVGKSAVSQYESGLRDPDSTVLTRLASSLGITTDWLLGLDAPRDFSAREARVEYTARPDRESSTADRYLADIEREVMALESDEDRHAVLEMVRALARRKREP